MPKSSKSRSTGKRVNVQDLPKRGKKVGTDEMKKVRGGTDFNNDGKVDGDDLLVLPKTAQKVREKL